MYPYRRDMPGDEPTMTDLRGVLPGQRPPVDATVLDEPTSEVPIIRPADLAGPEPEPTSEAAAPIEQDTAPEPTAEDAIYVDASAQTPPAAEVDPEPDGEPATDPAMELAALTPQPVAEEIVADEIVAQEAVAQEAVAHEAVAQEAVAEETVVGQTHAGTVTAAESVATADDSLGLASEPPMAPPLREPGPSAWPPPAAAAQLAEPAMHGFAIPEPVMSEPAIPAWREPTEAFAPEPEPVAEAVVEAVVEDEAEAEDEDEAAAAELDAEAEADADGADAADAAEAADGADGAEAEEAEEAVAVEAEAEVVETVAADEVADGEAAAETVAEDAAEADADADYEAEELIVELVVEPVVEELAEPAPRGPGEVTQAPIALWTDEAAARLREQWRDLQVQFFDDPGVAVAGAKNLVTEAVQELADTLLAAQDSLDPYRDAERVDTEAMRVAMRRYREFLDRVLAL